MCLNDTLEVAVSAAQCGQYPSDLRSGSAITQTPDRMRFVPQMRTLRHDFRQHSIAEFHQRGSPHWRLHRA